MSSPPSAHARVHERADFFELRLGVDGADVGVLVERIADAQRGGCDRAISCSTVAIHALLHEQARAGAADVALVEKDAVHDDALDGLIERGVLEDEVRGFAAEFEGEFLESGGIFAAGNHSRRGAAATLLRRGRAATLCDGGVAATLCGEGAAATLCDEGVAATLPAATLAAIILPTSVLPVKASLSTPGCSTSARARFACAGDDVHDAVGQAGFLENAAQGACAVMLVVSAGLRMTGVAAREGGRDFPRGHEQRENSTG